MERDFLHREISNLVTYEVPSYEYETNHFRPTSHQEGAGFYFQFNNADILYGNNKVAGWRTCNITCIAMILESLGIGKDSTKDNIDKNVLAKLAEFYRAKLGNKTLSNLRYPDFLQLLAIYLKLKNASGLDPGVIGRARDAAARSITDWSFMKEMTTSFHHLTFETKSVFNKTVNDGLKRLGWLTRQNKGKSDPGKADGIISLADYRESVLRTISKEVKDGFKIIIHQYNHFTVLVDLNNNEVRVNDPGTRYGGNMKLSWDQARTKGMFSGYMRCRSVRTPVVAQITPNSRQNQFSSNNLDQTVLKNRGFSKQLGWDKYIYQLNDLLLPYSGKSNVSLGEEDFASAVMKWQEKNGFTGRDVDGVIGPATWNKLRKQLGSINDPTVASSPQGNIAVAGKDRLLAKINQYNDLIESAGKKHNLHPNIIRAIIAAESGGDRYKRSSANYKGLMQAERTDDQYDPKISIETGTAKFAAFKNKYIVPHLTKFGIDATQIEQKVLLSLIIASYNAGQVTVLKALEYAYKSGDWRKWLDAENYQRALVFSRGYHTYEACQKNVTEEQIKLARQKRIEYSNWRGQGKWQNFPDPPPLKTLEQTAPKIMMCWVKTKHLNTSPYINRFLSFI